MGSKTVFNMSKKELEKILPYNPEKNKQDISIQSYLILKSAGGDGKKSNFSVIAVGKDGVPLFKANQDLEEINVAFNNPKVGIFGISILEKSGAMLVYAKSNNAVNIREYKKSLFIECVGTTKEEMYGEASKLRIVQKQNKGKLYI